VQLACALSQPSLHPFHNGLHLPDQIASVYAGVTIGCSRAAQGAEGVGKEGGAGDLLIPRLSICFDWAQWAVEQYTGR
jgi:hypothetical protein